MIDDIILSHLAFSFRAMTMELAEIKQLKTNAETKSKIWKNVKKDIEVLNENVESGKKGWQMFKRKQNNPRRPCTGHNNAGRITPDINFKFRE